MADRVQAVKWESPSQGGTQEDMVPTELDVNEDGLDARALFLQNDSSSDSTVSISRDASNNLTFEDPVVGATKTLTQLLAGGGITEAQHRTLDQLVHDLDENHYREYTYASGKVSNVTDWTDSGKTLKVREYDYTYTGRKVQTETVKQYDGAGSLVETLTYTYSYSGAQISNYTCVRS